MNQGIMLVTKDLQIPIINGRCAELLDLPSAVIDSPPRFDRLVNTEIGKDNVPLERPLAGTDKSAVSERRMQNGTVIEVRSGNLPDGGFVQTFTDITKRCESEARVARLASED